MLHFDIKRGGRKCFECQAPFMPGEKFFSALIEKSDGSTERRDYNEEHWNGPPEECIGWWAARVPEEGKKRIYWAPGNVMVAYLNHIRSQPESADVAFVTALLLVQKKLLTLEDNGGDESRLRLRSRADQAIYEIPVVEVSSSRLEVIQNELSERLFMDQPVGPDDESEPDEGLPIDQDPVDDEDDSPGEDESNDSTTFQGRNP